MPQPISVGTTGTPVSSANSTSRSAASALMMPPPATMRGRSAASSRSSALSIWARRRGRLVHRQRLRRCPGRTRSRACCTSIGRSISTGPGRPERIRWNACWKVPGTCAGSSTVTAIFVSGFAIGRDVDRLEVLLVQLGHRRLPGDAQDRDRVGAGRVQAGDHVGAGRTARADAHADVAGRGAGVALGHVRGALDVAGERVVQAAVGLHRLVERVDRRSGQPEDMGDPFGLQDLHRGLGRCHACHVDAPFGQVCARLAGEALDAAQQRRVVQAAVAVGARRGHQLRDDRADRERRRRPRARRR